MLILHDPATLDHRTNEYVLGKLRPAFECPERITSILSALEPHLSTSTSATTPTTITPNPGTHELRTLDYRSTLPTLHQHLLLTHSSPYLTHLATIHAEWVAAGVIEPGDSILPECFPYATGIPNHVDGPPVDKFARTGYFAFDLSTGIMSETWHAVLASAGLAYEAVRVLAEGDESETGKGRGRRRSSVLALCRPPGHHCDTKRAGGYCYVNNAVVAVSAIQSLPPSSSSAASPSTSPPSPPSSPKIAILDLDFHHGNGTQSAYYSSPSVLYVSIHGLNEFPYYTGSPSETGTGDGTGYNLNLPLPQGSPFSEYLQLLDIALERIRVFGPEWVVVSLGFDTFRGDPLGGFGIGTEDYGVMARKVRGAEGVRGVKSVILLEGGYVVEKIGVNLVEFLRGWEAAEAEGEE